MVNEKKISDIRASRTQEKIFRIRVRKDDSFFVAAEKENALIKNAREKKESDMHAPYAWVKRIGRIQTRIRSVGAYLSWRRLYSLLKSLYRYFGYKAVREFIGKHKRTSIIMVIILAVAGTFFYTYAPWRIVATRDGNSLQHAFGGAWLDSRFRWNNLDLATYQVPAVIHPRGLNILFVSDNFATFDEFKQSVATIMGTLKTTEPWESYDSFNVFFIFNRDDTMCAVDRANEYAPLLKCSKALITLAQTLPLVKVKVVVVSRRNFISWANLTRFENSFVFYSVPQEKENDAFNRKVILVELAHGFGMRDETRSVNAVSGEAPARPAPPNCAPTLNEANAWWGDMVKRDGNKMLFSRITNDVGFYFGCAGNDNYIRPTQQSLMNIQDFPGAESYGPVSERYLKKVLEYCFSDVRHGVSDDPAFFELYPELKECVSQ